LPWLELLILLGTVGIRHASDAVLFGLSLASGDFFLLVGRWVAVIFGFSTSLLAYTWLLSCVLDGLSADSFSPFTPFVQYLALSFLFIFR
jgi:hypothetical protein